MRVFLTGGTGFIGSVLARELRNRGDDVVAYVRNRDKAAPLADLGCDVVVGSITDTAQLTTAMEGVNAVIHCAGVYDVGVPESARPAMFEGNVTATERVLDAAVAVKAERILHISTVGAFGDTHGKVVDETYRHTGEYVSYYDETKHLAHVAAEERIAAGAPIIILQPGMVYGPGDTSPFAAAVNMFLQRRMPAVALPDNGFSAAHIDDIVSGIVAALDKGTIGETYVLSGDIVTMRQFIEVLAQVTGRKSPKFNAPTAFLRMLAPFGSVVGPALGLAPNLREVITAGDGVTYWATHEKATRELGYQPRPLAEGLRQTLQAEGRL